MDTPWSLAKECCAAGQSRYAFAEKRAQYKHRCYKKIQSESKFVANQWVFVDKVPLVIFKNTVDVMKTASYNNLQLRKDVLSRIVKVKSHAAVIDEDGVCNTVSILQITAACGLEGNKHAPMPGHARQSVS